MKTETAFASLGRYIFDKVTDHVACGECDEWCEEAMTHAEKLGLALREYWNPEKHSHIDGSPGTWVWTWKHLPDNWREEIPSPSTLWIHRGAGHYIGSSVLVCAENRIVAETLIRKQLDKVGLKNEPLEVSEVPLQQNSVITWDNGDY